VSEFVFAQQFLQPKLSHRCYASVLHALQNNTVFKLLQAAQHDSYGTHICCLQVLETA